MTTAPLQAVGKALGNRDHTTVIHGAEKIAKEVVQNESVRNTIDLVYGLTSKLASVAFS